jgi:hypothetical protein
MTRLDSLRPLLLPLGLIAVALTIYNLQVRWEMVDFEIYRTAAARTLSAAPLYQANDAAAVFTYLPAFAVAMIPMALLGSDAARITWFALSCAGLLLLLRWSVVALPARRWSDRSLIIVALILLVRFYLDDLTLGQSTVLLGVLLIAALGALQLEAPAPAAVCVGLAVFLDPVALILLPWLVVTAGPRTGLVAGATILAGLLLPATLYGWAGNLEQLGAWWQVIAQPPVPSVPGTGNLSLAALGTTWLGPGTAAALLATATAILLLAVAATVWRQRAPVDDPTYLEFALLLVLIPLLSPHGWDHVFVLATPAVVLIVDRWRELLPPWRWASGIALAALLLTRVEALKPFGLLSLCAITIVATLAQMRLRRLA